MPPKFARLSRLPIPGSLTDFATLITFCKLMEELRR